jgi:hypothetical protein
MPVATHTSGVRSEFEMTATVTLERKAVSVPRVSLLVLALAVVCAFALPGGVAQAEVPGLIAVGNFGEGELNGPVGVAVDQASGDVYVAGLHSRIDKFGPTEHLVAPPSPFGAEEPYTGVAVDPANGDVYAVNAAKQEIEIFNPGSGSLISSFPVPESGNVFGALTWVQIAVDAAGDVYLPNAPDNGVQEYTASGSLRRTITGSGGAALKGPTGVAIDPSGDVWVADAGDNRIEELDSTGAFVREIKSEGVQSVAVDTHGNVFALVYNKQDSCGQLATPCYHLIEYDPAGGVRADIGAGSIGDYEQLIQLSGAVDTVAVNDANDSVYIADGGHDVVWAYEPPAPPVVGREVVAETATSEAKLGALVAPGGLGTSYRFEYGTSTEYGHSAPVPEGSVGSGFSSRAVWAAALGLQPGTTYHYRVVAANALGVTVGPDETFTTTTAAESSCSNESFREGFSAGLPDCRAYELVSPSQADSGEPEVKYGSTQGDVTVAATNGERMAYISMSGLAGSQTAAESFLATRGPDGWTSESLIPRQSGYPGWECPSTGVAMPAFSSGLSSGVLLDGRNQQEVEENNETSDGNGSNQGPCGADSPELVSGEPHGFANLFVRDNDTGSYQLVDVTPPGVAPASAHFDAASSDLSHIVFDEHAQLTANAPGGFDDLYEWSGGVVRLVTVLPGGAPAVGSLAVGDGLHADSGEGVAAQAHVISSDGSRVFFSADGDLYVRENAEQPPIDECSAPGRACTVQLDASQAGGPGGGGTFMDAGADGSRIFFLDEASVRLTADTVAGSGMNLYEYDLESGTLSDLTSAGHAEVAGVSGISEDGSVVYFLADGVLASNENANKEVAEAGKPNLYVENGASTNFIAALASTGGDQCVLRDGCARVASNGAFFAFTSLRDLTGYDNLDASTGEPDPEVFLYDAGSHALSCASCNPSGEAPTAGATLNTGLGGTAYPHDLADSGRLFFETDESLLPSDTNGQRDVYEYENGQLYLISSGSSEYESVMLDASESGDDVFFLTRQQLLPYGPGGAVFAIYDARVDGGFPEPPPPPPCLTADACRAAASLQPSIFGAPASATFSGAGNLAPAPEVASKAKVKSRKSKPVACRKGLVKKRDRCVKRSKQTGTLGHANKRTGK